MSVTSQIDITAERDFFGQGRKVVEEDAVPLERDDAAIAMMRDVRQLFDDRRFQVTIRHVPEDGIDVPLVRLGHFFEHGRRTGITAVDQERDPLRVEGFDDFIGEVVGLFGVKDNGDAVQALAALVQDDVVIAGQVGIADHVTIKAGSVIGAKSSVFPNKIVRSGMWSGIPVRPIKEYARQIANLKSIEKLKAEVKELKKLMRN